MKEAVTIRIHVSADERYALYRDGACIGRGSERGDRRYWFTVSLPSGVTGTLIIGDTVTPLREGVQEISQQI